jgi:hypothetical protein
MVIVASLLALAAIVQAEKAVKVRAGAVTDFKLTFKKKVFAYKGQKYGYLLAKCRTGEFLAQAEAKFHDGTKVGPAKLTRACTPKG